MGFSYFNYGCIHPCGVKDGMVYYELPSGVIVKYKTSIAVDIEKQTIPFYSNYVAFCLESNGTEYVGRYDGSVSMYDTRTGLLIGLGNWEAPKYPEIMHCGFYTESSRIIEVYLDLRDYRTLYVGKEYMQQLLPNPIKPKFDLEKAFLSVNTYGNVYKKHIYDERGDSVASDVWDIQDSIRKRNCRSFI